MNLTPPPFVAVLQNELLLNAKRVAPYGLMLWFSGNAALWTIGGAATHYGWATNSDFFIARNFGGFAFGILGLPLFAALIMADPVIRDFQLQVDPLIFSKPVSRLSYLLGKFLGSFIVLVSCQFAFALTMIVLQVFHTSRMVVLPFRVFPYFKHFFFLVAISYLLFAAVYFTVGTLTRNAKIVYGLAVAYYPLYIAWQLIVLKNLPVHWQQLLDPLLMNREKEQPWGHEPSYVDRIVVSYGPWVVANRVVVGLTALGVLAMLCFRFSITERKRKLEHATTLNLTTGTDSFYYDPPASWAAARQGNGASQLECTNEAVSVGPLPRASLANTGARANLRKLLAAISMEFRLLAAERSLIATAPLVIFISILEVAFFRMVPEMSYAATYATNTAGSLSFLLLGVTIFYTGEALHRDRVVKTEPLLWSAPIANNVLLLSKFLATLLLTSAISIVVGLTSIAIQLLRGHYPIELPPYLKVYAIILFPALVFTAAATVVLNILLRGKYVTYAVSIALGAGLFYLYGQGHKHWLYNPLQYRLWQYSDLCVGNYPIMLQRAYWLAIAAACLLLAHLLFPRRSTN